MALSRAAAPAKLSLALALMTCAFFVTLQVVRQSYARQSYTAQGINHHSENDDNGTTATSTGRDIDSTANYRGYDINNTATGYDINNNSDDGKSTNTVHPSWLLLTPLDGAVAGQLYSFILQDTRPDLGSKSLYGRVIGPQLDLVCFHKSGPHYSGLFLARYPGEYRLEVLHFGTTSAKAYEGCMDSPCTDNPGAADALNLAIAGCILNCTGNAAPEACLDPCFERNHLPSLPGKDVVLNFSLVVAPYLNGTDKSTGNVTSLPHECMPFGQTGHWVATHATPPWRWVQHAPGVPLVEMASPELASCLRDDVTFIAIGDSTVREMARDLAVFDKFGHNLTKLLLPHRHKAEHTLVYLVYPPMAYFLGRGAPIAQVIYENYANQLAGIGRQWELTRPMFPNVTFRMLYRTSQCSLPTFPIFKGETYSGTRGYFGNHRMLQTEHYVEAFLAGHPRFNPGFTGDNANIINIFQQNIVMLGRQDDSLHWFYGNRPENLFVHNSNRQLMMSVVATSCPQYQDIPFVESALPA